MTILSDKDKEVARKVLEIISDYKVYSERFLKIRTKESQILNLKLNIVQEKVYEEILKLIEQGKPIRLVILKARQMGISTEISSLIFHNTVTHKNRNSFVMAHEPDSTKSIFEMYKFFWDNLPEQLQPMKRYDNTMRLTFDSPDEKQRLSGLKSQISVSTAQKKAIGRGLTLHNFHGSEVAFWPDAKETMKAVAQAVPDNKDTMIVLESTANGVGGYFYDIYWAAKKGENDYVAIFIPWFEFPEYSRKLDSGFILTKEEEQLKIQFKLTNEQVNWRRWAIANKCDGDILTFQQEYPATDREAFLASGTPRFNIVNLSIYHDNIPKPIFVGELNSEDKREAVKTPEVFKDGKGRFRMYKYPSIKHSYVIGGDTAKGTQWSDYSVLQVLDKHTGDQVATWRGKIDPTKFAYQAARLGYFYKGGQDCALIGIEVNKDGITTNKVLYNEIGYKRLYRRRIIDSTTEKTEMKIGFHTNERSRELILNKLARWINEGEFIMNDETTILECMTFVYDENGKCQAQEGCFDDCVISLAIAIHLFDYNVKIEPAKTDIEKLKIGMKQKKLQVNW